MRKLLLLVMGLGVVSSACQADVLVYKIKNTSTITGNGITRKDSIGGWIVWDPQNALLTLLNVTTNLRQFQVQNKSDSTIATLNGGTKQYTVIVLPGDGIGSVLAKGVNRSLNAGTITTWSAPKTMTLDGSDFISPQVEEDKGTLTFDQKTTMTQNGIDANFTNSVSRLRQILLDQGLTEVN